MTAADVAHHICGRCGASRLRASGGQDNRGRSGKRPAAISLGNRHHDVLRPTPDGERCRQRIRRARPQYFTVASAIRYDAANRAGVPGHLDSGGNRW